MQTRIDACSSQTAMFITHPRDTMSSPLGCMTAPSAVVMSSFVNAILICSDKSERVFGWVWLLRKGKNAPCTRANNPPADPVSNAVES